MARRIAAGHRSRPSQRQATGRDSESDERWPGRPCPPGAELQPAERIGDPHRAGCLANLVGRHDVERLAGERGGQPGAAADRGEVSPYKPDLAHECPLGPGRWQRSRVGESTSQAERLSRQRPPGRRRLDGSASAVRGEENRGQREADRLVAGAANGDWHGQTVRSACQRHAIVTSTFAIGHPSRPLANRPLPEAPTWR